MTRSFSSRTILLLLATLVAASGCPVQQPGGSFPGRAALDGVSQTIPLIAGRLLDREGRPVAGATVRAYSPPYRVAGATTPSSPPATAKTDADGSFVLSDPPLGTVAVEAEGAAGAKALKTGVTVASGAQIALGTLTLRPTGTIRGRVTTPEGGSLLGTDVFIPGTDYLARADAEGHYALTGVPEGTFALAAMRARYRPRVLEGIQLAAGSELVAPVLELSLDAPVLKAISPDHGGPGTIVRLSGENFGAGAQRVLQVSFGDTLAVTVRRLDDAVIEAVVPPGATSGDVVVRTDGVASEGRPFRVLSSVVVTPPYVGLYLGAQQAFRAVAKDTEGLVVPDAHLDWDLGTPDIASLDARGSLTSLRPGWSEVRAKSGTVTGVAAAGISPFRQVLARAIEAGPNGYWIDTARGPDGSLYLSDWQASRIIRLAEGTPAQLVAGTGTAGSSPDGTPAMNAPLNHPHGIAVDAEGTLFIAENEGHRLLAIPARDTILFGRSMRAGCVYVVAGTGVKGFDGDGPMARERQLSYPGNLLLEPDGSLLFADTRNNRIRRLSPDGALSTVVGGGARPTTSAGIEGASYGEPVRSSLAQDAAGNIAFSDGYRLLVLCRMGGRHFGRDMTPGMVYPVAGYVKAGFNGDGPGRSALISSPIGLAFTPQGHLLFCDGNGTLLRVLRMDGEVRTLAGQRYPDGLGMLNTSDLLPMPAPASARLFGGRTLEVMPDGSVLFPASPLSLYRLELAP